MGEGVMKTRVCVTCTQCEVGLCGVGEEQFHLYMLGAVTC